MFEVKSVEVDIEGISPGLIMSNGAMADPLNDYRIRLDQLNSNKSNSLEVQRQKAKYEFLGFAYTDEKGHPVLPVDNLHAALAKGATKLNSMKGKNYFSGIFVKDHARLVYDGPDTVNKLQKQSQFNLRLPVVIAKQRVFKTRPVFKKWAATIHIEYEPDQLDVGQLREIINKAGRLVGLGDWRPSAPKPGKYGRFIVKEIREN